MHDLAEHLTYLSDSSRLALFESALRATVRPGDAVVDLGCGSGVLGMMALKAGAARVFSVDTGPMLDVARESFRRSGANDRVALIRARAQRVVLPEPADVAVCDHVGHFGFDYGIIDLLRDARVRLLKPQGVVMPRTLRLHVAAVESPPGREADIAWDDVPSEFRWLREAWLNTKHPVRLAPGHLLGPPAELGSVELGAQAAEFLSWTVELPIARDAILHGVAGWFEAELSPGSWMTNSPLANDRIDRSQAFLPIDPTPVAAGNLVRATVMARPCDDLIAWDIEIPAQGRRFRHSTLFASTLSRDGLANASGARIPRVTEEARARAIVLGFCDGRRSAAEVEDAVLREHPSLFPSPAEIRAFVAGVLRADTAS